MRRLLLFLLSHRSLATLRWDIHFMWVRLGNWAGGQRSRAARLVSSRSAPVLLNLGAGPRGRDDGRWVNVDGYNDANVHLLVDLQRRLPFADASFDGVFSEHVLEHFTEEDGLRLASDVARILRPGGVFRVVVPDGEFVMRSYFDDPEGLVRYRGAGEPGETAMEMVNSFFRQRYEHQFMYDWPTLRRLLERAGFAEVLRCAFGQSPAGLGLQIDHEKYQRESLYVEARKPSGALASQAAEARAPKTAQAAG
ncbi:MAG TPA: methyltransferase domain-containing protein [Caulobacteraceae bacterium]